MKRTFVLVVLVANVAIALATPSISGVSAKQRWPWSPVVDIDIICDGVGVADAILTATYDGSSGNPVELLPGIIEGSPTLGAGHNHLVWDPIKAGLGSVELKNFVVSASLVDSDLRKYLVIDLMDGSYEYAANPPSGGWNQDIYKTRYLVFRRIPAGSYTLGYTTDQIERFANLGASYKVYYSANLAVRTVKVTSDYYMGIFMATVAQVSNIESYSAGNIKMQPCSSWLSDWRGSMTNGTLGVTWPRDGHRVATDSITGKLRALCANSLPAHMIIDLPTEAQWEIAARAGTTTYYPNGGTLESSVDDIKTLQNEIGTNRTENVGLMAANGWGFFDMLGIAYEMTLNVCTIGSTVSTDNYPVFKVPGQVVDPVGMTVEPNPDLAVVVCNSGWFVRGANYAALPTNRRAYRMDPDPSKAKASVRFAIHLSPLVK